MQQIRKYAPYVLIAALLVFIGLTGNNACTRSQKNNRAMPKTDTGYEPKFRKDGDLWLLKAGTADTLMHLDVEYANTPNSIEYGMMYRKSMDENMSMLFFMGEMQPRSFWMKNTYVSLDIIFIDSKLQVVSIQKNAEPLNTKSLPSEGPAQYVLEVKGGLCDKIGLEKGDMINYKDVSEAL